MFFSKDNFVEVRQAALKALVDIVQGEVILSSVVSFNFLHISLGIPSQLNIVRVIWTSY